MKKIDIENRINKQSNGNMFSKANANALAGLPLSIVLNIIITFPVSDWLLSNHYDYFLGALILSVPFYWASVGRQYIIDWVYAVYNLDINPKTLMEKLYHRIKNL